MYTNIICLKNKLILIFTLIFLLFNLISSVTEIYFYLDKSYQMIIHVINELLVCRNYNYVITLETI